MLVLARIALIASLAAGTVPCVGTQREKSVDNSDDVVDAEQRLPRAKDIPVPLGVPLRRSTRSRGEHGQDMNWSESDGRVAFLTGPAWLLQRVTLPPNPCQRQCHSWTQPLLQQALEFPGISFGLPESCSNSPL